MVNYKRTDCLSSLLVGLSPNIQSIDACHGYSFLGVLAEIRPFDVGIKTAMAFQCLLLPDTLKMSEQIWDTLSRQLVAYGINSQPYHYFSERKKQSYTGLRFSISSINTVPSFAVSLHIARFFQSQGVSLTFSGEFDKVVGTRQIQHVLTNTISHNGIIQECLKNTRAFAARAQSIYLYQPKPVILASE